MLCATPIVQMLAKADLECKHQAQLGSLLAIITNTSTKDTCGLLL